MPAFLETEVRAFLLGHPTDHALHALLSGPFWSSPSVTTHACCDSLQVRRRWRGHHCEWALWPLAWAASQTTPNLFGRWQQPRPCWAWSAFVTEFPANLIKLREGRTTDSIG